MSAAELAGVDQQAEQDEQADLRQPAEPLGEGPGRRAVRQPGVGEHDRGQIGGDEAAGVRAARRGERDHAEPERRDGYSPDAGSAMRRSAIAPRKPQPSPIAAPTAKLVDQLGDGVLRLEAPAAPR